MITKQEFTLPIENCKEKYIIDTALLEDLELIQTKDPSENPIYNTLFKPKTSLGTKCLQQWGKYYTVDTKFLKDSQKIYKSLNLDIDAEIVEKAYNDWKEIKNTENFCEKYQYIEWDRIKGINRYSIFLTFLSYYNLSSPLFNLALPIIILIIPFFILKMGKVPITFTTYSSLVIMQLKNHIIGKIFYNFRNTDWNQRIYYIFSFGIYIYSIYQNIISCYRFYMNTYKISNYFSTLQKYLQYTIRQMDYVHSKTKNFKTYDKFSLDIINNREKLQIFFDEVKTIHGKILSFKKLAQIGYVMKQFFILYDDIELEEAFLYSFGFNGYIDTIAGLRENIEKKAISKVRFSKSKKPIAKFTNSYSLSFKNPVKNNVCLEKNIIITGPNAAGKTSLIKSTLLNILFSQQVGFGAFTKGKITPFHYIHAYINIPDSISRDSLFQAEARRCKDILDIIEKDPYKRHFCIFDELYSGTNPYEAVSSAYSYLKYVNKFNNVKYMLTTHYIKLCKLFEKDNDTKNFNMETKIIDKKPHYLYKIIAGTSYIKGGICVLRQLRYPNIILRTTEKILRTL